MPEPGKIDPRFHRSLMTSPWINSWVAIHHKWRMQTRTESNEPWSGLWMNKWHGSHTLNYWKYYSLYYHGLIVCPVPVKFPPQIWELGCTALQISSSRKEQKQPQQNHYEHKIKAAGPGAVCPSDFLNSLCDCTCMWDTAQPLLVPLPDIPPHTPRKQLIPTEQTLPYWPAKYFCILLTSPQPFFIYWKNLHKKEWGLEKTVSNSVGGIKKICLYSKTN